jgi:hypothetical protein
VRSIARNRSLLRQTVMPCTVHGGEGRCVERCVVDRLEPGGLEAVSSQPRAQLSFRPLCSSVSNVHAGLAAPSESYPTEQL